MKHIIFLLAISLSILSCKNKSKTAESTLEADGPEMIYASFGDEITVDDVLDSERITELYQNLKVGDTVDSKMKGKIIKVCPKKGCWMTLDIDGENDVMVKFKDYGFFMPLNAVGDVVINGKAFVTETSVDELRHYAEDAGESEDQIAAITAPKFEYRFEADGVLLKE